MSEIINLRLARKRAARKAGDAEAAANRAKHGLGKAERLHRAAEEERARKALDGAKLAPETD
jgi:hypothetical protein